MSSSHTLLISVALGIVFPAIVSFIKHEKWPEKLTFVVAAALSGVIAIAELLAAGSFHTWRDFVSNYGVIFGTSQVVYRTYFVDSALNNFLTKKF